MRLDGSRVVVTGADGFIGSHLVGALVAAGARVTAFCYYNSFGSRGWLDAAPGATSDEVAYVLGDVRDPNSVRAALAGADVVFHLAALIGIPYSYEAPDSYVDTNVKGTLNVLMAARALGLARVVVTSTSEVYGTAQYVPIDERHPLRGQSPYSASKIGADKLAESFHLSFDLPVVVARPFNTYGPRQSARAVIPTIISQLLGGATTLSLGSLHPTRDLTYVDDVCRGFLALAVCDAAIGREVNIGTGAEVSVGQLARTLMEIVGVSPGTIEDELRVRPAASEVERLVADATLLRELTGWQPEVPLEEGLRRTVEWFKDPANLSRYRVGEYVV